LKEYPTKAIAEITGLSPQKVRSYAQALEKAGYKITRNDRGFRIFTDHEILLFQEMIKQSKETGMTIEQIAIQLVTNQNSDTVPGMQLSTEEETPIENEVEAGDLPQIGDDMELGSDTDTGTPIENKVEAGDLPQIGDDMQLSSEEETPIENELEAGDLPQIEDDMQMSSEADTPMINEVETIDLPQNEEDRYKILLDEINSLKQLIANQQKHIEECIEQQRDLKSLELLRESQEFKRQILELAASQENEKKKGFFRKLFKM
jgi:DNA-binding transcriptional MerR regulator